MDRNDFIDRIASRHRASFASMDEMQTLKQDYFAVLDVNVDFDKLFQCYLDEYNFNVPPKPAWFKQRAKKKHPPTSSPAGFEIKSIYAKLPNGMKYEFAYTSPMETEEQAKQAVRDRFKTYIDFITKEEYRA